MSDNTDPDYHASNSNQNHYQYYYNYTVHDETLNEDISKAHAFAKKLVEEFFSELKRNSKLAIKGAWGEVAGYLIGFIVLFIISLILGLCIH